MSKTRPCEICGELIDTERANAMPDTRLCTEHAKEIAKYGGEFRVSSQHEKTSKVGSLKKNYGSVLVSKHRNLDAINRLKDAYEIRSFENGS